MEIKHLRSGNNQFSCYFQAGIPPTHFAPHLFSQEEEKGEDRTEHSLDQEDLRRGIMGHSD